MKKFSKITNQKVNQEPNQKSLSKKEIEIYEKRDKILFLIENTLSVRAYGSPHPSYNLSMKIEGKDLLAAALVELFEQGSKSDQVKILESLKFNVKDWKNIDEKIDSISLDKMDIGQYNKNMKMLSLYDNNEDDFRFIVNQKLSNIKSDNELQKRYECVNYMIKEGFNYKGLEILKELIEKKVQD